MSSEPAVTETVTNLARCLADDVQDHLGLSQYRANSDRDLDVTVTYNGWGDSRNCGWRRPLCGWRIHYVTGVCTYFGIRRCSGQP